ncbi:MAG: hypothetical protein V2J02_19305 [Pseudomonadales bacterium]|jgi:hypothetical protein|nr:hypothetical protein [Pseudomonadales bacterium]
MTSYFIASNRSAVDASGLVVAIDREADILVTWNESATFNVWAFTGDAFVNVDCFTVYGVADVHEAREHGLQHLAELVETVEAEEDEA